MIKGLWRGLASQFTLLIVVMGVSLLLAGGSLLIGLGYQTDRDRAISGQQNTACQAAITLSNYLSERFNVLDLVAVGATYSPETLSAMIQTVGLKHPELLEIVVINDNAVNIAHLNSGESLIVADDFRNVSGHTLGEVVLESPDKPYLTLATIAEKGIVAARMNLEALWQYLGEMPNKTYILNQDRTVIAHADPAVVMAQRQNRFVDGGNTYEDFDGNAVVGASCAIKGTAWLAVSETPSSEAFVAASTERGRIWMLFLALTTSLTAIFGWWMARRVIQPLRHLINGVQQISDGNLEYRNDMTRRDEIGDLSRAIDEMTQQLAQRTSEILWLNQNLEERVSARTRELKAANARMEAIAEALYHTSQRANAANQAKSQFLANMSHELRTPLNSMIMYHDLLLRGSYGELNDKQKDRLVKSRMSAKLLLELISDVLDLAKIEAGELVFQKVKTDLKPILETFPGVIEPLLKSDKVVFEMKVEPNLPDVIGDDKRIQQVILNLLSNAAKFTHQGKVVLSAWSLTTQRHLAQQGQLPGGVPELADGHWIAISISDTGIGIPAEMLDAVFEEFKQVDDSNTREYGGTGLGLAICKRFVQAMGGQIGLTSTVGEGSTFSFVLPAEPILQPE